MKIETTCLDPVLIRRVLVTKLRHHGDVLLCTPVFASLKRQLPGVEVDVLILDETRDMLADNPHIDQVYTIKKTRALGGGIAKLGYELRQLRELRRRRYDLLLHLTETSRGAALARLIKPRWSVGMDGPWSRHFKQSFSHLYFPLWGNRRHIVEQNLDALRVIGLYPEACDKQLVLLPGADARARVAGELAAAGMGGTPYLLLHPGSRWAYKTWPAERVAALARRLLTDGHRIVLTGAPDPAERQMADAILAALPAGHGVLDLVGKLSLRELAAAIDGARLMLGVDSVPMHMAAALQTPVVALFGPSNVHEWGPWRVAHRLVAADLPCRPCGLKGCANSGYSECLAQLPESTVLAAVAALLQETGAP
ncbi:putative lipopolysaccharide heptosyltransferase III [Chitinimonas sp.]|uniref:putative lipopolysaccharide heptosyltransferase III n=1 Tax=Chitinimonas sp. TaxID=1934313 RepID=UPI0035AF786C